MLIEEAKAFAEKAHKNQRRKYDDVPYVVHLESVVRILQENGIEKPEILAAAWLHDTVEDTDTTIQQLTETFGPGVGELVYWLTDDENGNRKSRTQQSAWRLARAPLDAKLIKLADIIDNGTAIAQTGHKFAPIFLEEKRLILQAMRENEGEELLNLPLFQRAAVVTEGTDL